ncbi:hypothetical protein LINPERPRIM_LOCUS20736 [Linum perenne]
MEGLSRLLDIVGATKVFPYHPQCSRYEEKEEGILRK